MLKTHQGECSQHVLRKYMYIRYVTFQVRISDYERSKECTYSFNNYV